MLHVTCCLPLLLPQASLLYYSLDCNLGSNHGYWTKIYPWNILNKLISTRRANSMNMKFYLIAKFSTYYSSTFHCPYDFHFGSAIVHRPVTNEHQRLKTPTNAGWHWRRKSSAYGRYYARLPNFESAVRTYYFFNKLPVSKKRTSICPCWYCCTTWACCLCASQQTSKNRYLLLL